MDNALIGICFVIAAVVITVWRTVGDVRSVLRGEIRRGPAGETCLATGDYGSMGLGADGGSAGHAGGGCGADGGGGGHC